MKILLIVIILCFSIYGNAQIDTVSLRSLKLKGNIKSVTEYTFLAKDSLGHIVKDRISDAINDYDKEGLLFTDESKRQTNFKYEYSRSGNMTSKTIFYNVGVPYRLTTFKYNQNIQIIDESSKMIFSDGILEFKIIYAYSSDKSLIAKSEYTGGSLLWKTKYEHKKGKLASETRINNEGQLDFKYEYKYTNGVLSEKINYGENGNLESRYIYEYDSIGNETKSSIVFFDGQVVWTESYYDIRNNLTKLVNSNNTYVTKDYDIENKIIKVVFYGDNNEIISTTEYKYKNDKLVEEVVTTNEKKKIIEYDNSGLIRKYCILFTQTSDCYNYDIVYDSNSNWKNIIEYRNSIPIKIRERIILYYK